MKQFIPSVHVKFSGETYEKVQLLVLNKIHQAVSSASKTDSIAYTRAYKLVVSSKGVMYHLFLCELSSLSLSYKAFHIISLAILSRSMFIAFCGSHLSHPRVILQCRFSLSSCLHIINRVSKKTYCCLSECCSLQHYEAVTE